KEGAGNAPAYRGTAYIVFERLDLAPFGNRIPQFSFEVIRRIGRLETKVSGVALIPGATEFGYEPTEVFRVSRSGQGEIIWSETENRHHLLTKSDWNTSLDHLDAMLPNCDTIHLVVAWFGTDLRAGHCRIEPRVETHDKDTHPIVWQVAGLTRATATAVTRSQGRPAYGGSPNDASIVAAIQSLKARGYKVMLHPFIMMDVDNDSGLPDPYGASEQPPYPWRGRITCHPAPGQPGSPDKSAAAEAQIDDLVGVAAPEHFSRLGATVTYSGPAEWSYRRFVLHLAMLAQAAGGVDAFMIGSEMVGLTTVRSDTNSYPFVSALKALTGDVRTIVGTATKIGYGADWSEYHSHRPDDGSGDVYFNMDALWADPDIDFIGIDNYLPMSDWRSGTDHADHDPHGPVIPHDPDYLAANVEGGEYYDWYYASTAARQSQSRTPITDGAHGEPWVFRQKDLVSWWSNTHRHRPGGNPAGPSPWTAKSKPIWFTEIGFPALDNAANQPNVFHDPKSSESAYPHQSSGARDDAMQRAALEALIDYWQPESGNNPSSPHYSGRMIDPDRMFVWAWDARPWPAFPLDLAVWSDGENWRSGHWISGRMGTAALAGLVEEIAEDFDLSALEVETLGGSLDGFVIDRPMSFRQAVEGLSTIYGFDAIETGASIKIRGRCGQVRQLAVSQDNLVDRGEDEPLHITRRDLSELPLQARISYQDGELDGRPATVEAMRAAAPGTDRVLAVETPGVLDAEQMAAQCDAMLRREWAARDSGDFTLMPSQLAVEPADLIGISADSEETTWLVTELSDGDGRAVVGQRILDGMFDVAQRRARTKRSKQRSKKSPSAPIATLTFLELRNPEAETDAATLLVAGSSAPWSNGLVLYREVDNDALQYVGRIEQRATIGRLVTDLYPGPVWRWDRVNSVTVELARGTLSSRSERAVLGGKNAIAVEDSEFGWEVIQFRDAELVAERTYTLSHLLRGQAGTERAAKALKSGSRIVVLDAALFAVSPGSFAIDQDAIWRFGQAGRALTPDTLATKAYTPTGDSLRPLSPVHVKAWRAPDTGDVVLSWIRRTRLSGDGWGLIDAPLGEASERYQIDILDGGDVKRRFVSTLPTVTYSQADQTADFGGLTVFDVEICQLSTQVGAGDPLGSTIHV
ncbi:MAG: glycoside hydrolase/phage tail family protein, partial [Pseudomonadota bacterium]